MTSQSSCAAASDCGARAPIMEVSLDIAAARVSLCTALGKRVVIPYCTVQWQLCDDHQGG